MLNVQRTMFNEWTNGQCFKLLDHFFIGNSLKIENCKLIIAAPKGGA